jgi:uncharacterized protein (DUF488 family)
MDSVNSLIARQYVQERIATAQVERLAREARQAQPRTRSRRRLFRRIHRPVVADVAPRR